ncbi:MAG: hypothetical protein LBK25_02960 [Treponema sp.]|jgi:hypothetical protein|nr:hypothetical protein [Treponema sp.]
MKKKLFLSGILGVALVFAIVVIGCDNDDGGEEKNTDPKVYFLSGSFGNVQFNLESSETSPSASVKGRSISRAVGDNYDLTGVLEDGAVLARLRGSYDPESRNWSVSARSSNDVVYTFDGRVDDAGGFRDANATIVEPTSADEWEPVFSPVAKRDTPWDFAGEPVESEESGMPSVALGYWSSSLDTGVIDGDEKILIPLGCLISDWKVKVITTETVKWSILSPYMIFIDQNQTLIKVTDMEDGTYEVINCYPYYKPTAANYAAALTAWMRLEEGAITGYEEHPLDREEAGDRWVYIDPAADDFPLCILPTVEEEQLLDFHQAKGWERWAVANNIQPSKRYAQYKFVFTDDNTFDMIQMIEGGGEGGALLYYSHENHYIFDSLEALNAANLQDERVFDKPLYSDEWIDLGVLKRTFTRN